MRGPVLIVLRISPLPLVSDNFAVGAGEGLGDKLRPDCLPVVGAEVSPRDDASCRVFNIHAPLDGYAALLPVADGLRRYTENFSESVLTAYAIGCGFEWVFFLHARYGTRKV